MNFAPEGGGEQMWMGEGGGNVLSQWWRCWAGHIMQRGWGLGRARINILFVKF